MRQVSAPPPVAWRLTIAGPRLGVALELGDAGASTGRPPGVLLVAVRNAVVAMQDTLEVRHKGISCRRIVLSNSREVVIEKP